MYAVVPPAAYHILVLDDEPAILALVTNTLVKSGFTQISTCSSIAGARQCWHAQTGKFDLVLADFCLPDGWAPELLKDLLRHKPHLRIILMSGFSADDLGLDEELARHLDVLQKPFGPGELIHAVENGLQRLPIAPGEEL